MFEYMAAGVPVIISNFDLWEDLLEKAKCGVSCDPHDHSKLKALIHEMLTEDQKASKLGLSGQLASKSDFCWESEEKKLTELYNSF